MGGMFYSLEEVAGKLNKTGNEIKELVKQGRLREFRDGQNLLFKIDEVESLLCDTTFMASIGASDKPGKESDEDEILLVTEPAEGSAPKAGPSEEGTTLAGEGINVLDETESDYKLADDTLGETKAVADEGSLEKIEEDVSLDSFGSGSGLLDLSLQADDTSLGGILDEIYTPEGAGKQEAPKAGSVVEVAAEAEQIAAEELAEASPVLGPVVVVGEYVEAAPDASNGLFGAMLFVAMMVTAFTAIVAVASINGVRPAILEQVQGLIWYVVIGVAVVEVLLFGMTFMVGGGGTKADKAPKVKKEKKAKKEKKSKKAKKEEEQKEEAPKEETLQEPAEPEDKTA